MRPAIALLLATTGWATTCGTLPPCAVLTPDLTVAIAEILEAPLPTRDSVVPVRMKLKTLIYGRSPGAEFLFLLPTSYNLPVGSLFYIESRQPLQSTICGLSGPYPENQQTERIREFQRLAARSNQPATFHVHASNFAANSLSGARITLRDSTRPHPQTTDIEGNANWPGLPPGRYSLTATHSDLQVEDPEKALAAVDLLPGSCTGRQLYLLPPYALSGIARTQDNRPARELPVYLRDASGYTVADTTTASNGAFALRHIAAGTYTLYAGDGPIHRSPYAPYLYPGVSTQSAATTLHLGPGHQAVPIQITVPSPAPVRTIQLILPRPLGPMEVPILSADSATIYSRTWSTDRTTFTLTVPPTQSLKGRFSLLPPRDAPFEFAIPAGTEPITLHVQLQ